MSGLSKEQDAAVSVRCHRSKDVEIWCESEHEDLRPAHHLEGALRSNVLFYSSGKLTPCNEQESSSKSHLKLHLTQEELNYLLH